MDLIKGGDEPQAHMHRRMSPECDLCGAPLKGPMPKPYWVAASARHDDEHGHPVPEDAHIRMYLCKEHRAQMEEALQRAYRRERNRSIQGQRLFPQIPSVRPVEGE